MVDADLKSYFDTISWGKLTREVEKKVADSRVLELIAAMLRQGVMDGLEYWQCLLKRRRKILRCLYRVALGAEAARVGREIGVDQRRADDATWIFPLLMHADRAIGPIVGDHRHDRQRILYGCGQLLARHQETPVALEIHHRPCRVGKLGRDRGRQAIAHGARCRRELRAVALVLEVAVHEGGVVAGAIGDDAVFGQHLGYGAHDVGEFHGSRQRDRLEAVLVD